MLSTCLEAVICLESRARFGSGLEKKHQPGARAVDLLRGRLSYKKSKNVLNVYVARQAYLQCATYNVITQIFSIIIILVRSLKKHFMYQSVPLCTLQFAVDF